MTPPPLRFLIAVVGGWACARGGGALWSGGPAEAGPAPAPHASAAPAPAAARSGGRRAHLAAPAPRPPRPAPAFPVAAPPRQSGTPRATSPAAPGLRLLAAAAPAAAAFFPPDRTSAAGGPPPLPPPPETGGRAAAPARAARAAPRWSLAGWAQLRPGAAPPLAPGGMIGGSQAGLRFAYRLAGGAAAPLAVTARLSGPLRSPAAEAAIGLEWQVSPAVPLRIAAERRQALAGAGRSALALSVHGGVSGVPVAGPLRLDAYGQAGLVGLGARDAFADGMVRVALPIDRGGRLRLGAGAWAAAQPGAARLDIGPGATLRLPGATLALDWRHRAAGAAAPGSGPAITLWSDFR